ncbi:MAG: prepilin peptidase [Agromyces sp.]
MLWPNLVLIAVVLGFAPALVRADLREHRLPNALTLGLAVSVGTVALAAALSTGEWGHLLSALLGAAAMTMTYWLLALVPNGMGYGDVKLAVSIGFVTGWWGWQPWFVAVIAAFIFGGVGALWRIVRGGAMRQHIAFGPAMLLGWAVAAWTALA